MSVLSTIEGVEVSLSAQARDYLSKISEHVVFAFQPIVNIHSGIVYGYEALLRGHREMGLTSIQGVFDSAWQLGVLHQADLLLREMALRSFSSIPHAKNRKLFYNVDGRTFESPDYHPEKTRGLLKELSIPASALCMELSERYDNSAAMHVSTILDRYRRQSYQIAIDDYGRGFSQLKMLYEHQPDYLKIDRFFIDGMAQDPKKALMIDSVVRMAHMLGITVIAEGIETEADFLACKAAGCDLAQGYLIERPQQNIAHLPETYESVSEINRNDRRRRSQSSDEFRIRDQMNILPSIGEMESMEMVLDQLAKHPNLSLLPVVDSAGQPRGLIREADLKTIVYSRFGHALLTNRALGNPIDRFIRKCPIADINSTVEDILDIFARAENSDGILITDEFRYAGFLSTPALLHLVHEKRLEQARDQNPLTKLPGNNSIADHISTSLESNAPERHTFVYFDFNDFKPFNDHYGFRQGDRAILLFAEIMQRNLAGTFIGHIGGDDFFAAFEGKSLETVSSTVQTILQTFERDIESFYDLEDRTRGYLDMLSRDGTMRRFSLLSCSAAVVTVAISSTAEDADRLVKVTAMLKKQAKAAASRVAIGCLSGETA